MKQIRMIILFLFCAWLSFSHAQTTFNKLYDTNNGVELALKALEYEDGYLIYGEGYEYTGGNRREIMIRKIDFSGNLLWEKYFKSIGYGIGARSNGILKTNNGDIFIAGLLTDSLTFEDDAYIFRLTPSADTVFFKRFLSSRIEAFYSAREKNDKKGFYLTGVTYSKGDIAGDIYVVKTDSMGNIEWDTTYGGLGVLDEGYSIDYTAEGNIIIGAGSAQFSPKPYSPWVIEINTTGAIQWQRKYGTQTGSDCGASIINLQNNNKLIYNCVDTVISSGADEKPNQITRIDNDGNIVWRSTFDNSKGHIIYNSLELSNGDIVLAGSTINDNGKEVGWLYKTDANGNELWERQYQSQVNDTIIQRPARLWDVEAATDGGLIAVGSAFGTSNASDFWVLKLDVYGCEEPGCQVGINDPQTPKGGLRVYPNPATEEITIEIQNTKHKIAGVRVYDVAGKTQALPPQCCGGELEGDNINTNPLALWALPLKKGESAVSLNLNGFPIGLYFVEVTLSNGSVERVKFIKQ